MRHCILIGLLMALCVMQPAFAQTDAQQPLPGSAEYEEVRAQVLLIGNFLHQLNYFHAHYGRVPSSYEEWRDSGFLLFTPWSGNGKTPAMHINRTPSVETDPYGTFHYQCTSPTSYKLELLTFVSEGMEVLTYERDLSKPFSGPGTGYRYLEAKADACYSLLDLLWIHTMEFPGNQPASLLDAVDGYVSLVPEGFRMPEGVDTNGAFELGFDFATGYNYFLSNLAKSCFAIEPPAVAYGDIDNPPETISDDRLVLFSSEMLIAGYPGLFD